MPQTAKDILDAAPEERLRLLRENMDTLSGDDPNEIIRSVTNSVTQKLATGTADLTTEALTGAIALEEDVDQVDPDMPAAITDPVPLETTATAPLVLTDRLTVQQELPAATGDDTKEEGEGYETVAIEMPDMAEEEVIPANDANISVEEPAARDIGLAFDPSEFNEHDEETSSGADDVTPEPLETMSPQTTGLVTRHQVAPLSSAGDGGDEPQHRSPREKVLGLLPVPVAVVAAYIGTDPISAAISAPPKFNVVVTIVVLLMVSWLVCEATRVDTRRNTSLTVRLAAALSCYYPIESWSRSMAGESLTASDLIYLLVPLTLGISVMWSAIKDRGQ